MNEEATKEEPTPVTDEVTHDVEPEQVLVDDAPNSPTDVVNDETLVPTQKPKAKTRSKKKQTLKQLRPQRLNRFQ